MRIRAGLRVMPSATNRNTVLGSPKNSITVPTETMLNAKSRHRNLAERACALASRW